MTEPVPGEVQALSFRDPAGWLVRRGGRLLRVVRAGHAEACRDLLDSPFAAARVATGELVGARRVEDAEARALVPEPGALVLEHPAVWFPSYPGEWPAEMLAAAAGLTLDLAEGALAAGLTLKDATPWNVLFEGPRPMHVDWLSFEPRAPGDATWRADAQLQRAFLLPLLAYRDLGLEPAQVFLASREGLTPESVHRAASPLRRLLPPYLTLATLPTWLAGRAESSADLYRARPLADPARARFVLEQLLARRRRMLERLAPAAARKSAWSGYMADRPGHYAAEDFALKERFVAEHLAEVRPASLLDIGANTGHFSRLAARAGARVVAIDTDPVVVGESWRQARRDRLDILPLIVNLARPTPAAGWELTESRSFLDRARGQFDSALLLAVMHHLLVGERVPLERLCRLLSGLVRHSAVLEWVAPADPMFRRIARGRDALHGDLDEGHLRRALAPDFELCATLPLRSGTRTLYALRRRAR